MLYLLEEQGTYTYIYIYTFTFFPGQELMMFMDGKSETMELRSALLRVLLTWAFCAQLRLIPPLYDEADDANDYDGDNHKYSRMNHSKSPLGKSVS